MASSRLIAAGEQYTPDDINNLRSDVLDTTSGHPHDGVDGRRIPFSNLDVAGASGSTAPSGGTKSYDDIEGHLTNSQGQHQLHSSVYVAGGAAPGTLVQAGTETLPTGSGTRSKTVFFPIQYGGIPVVTATMYAEPGTAVYTEQGPWITNRTASSFTMNAGDEWAGELFGWIAVGTKAA